MRFEPLRYVVLGALVALFGSVLLAIVPATIAEGTIPSPTVVANVEAVL